MPARSDWTNAFQMSGAVLRGARVWGVLFAAAFVTRLALDWLAPPADFHVRSTVSTFLGIGLLLAAGLWASLRSGSIVAGTVAGIAATCIAAGISIVAAAGLLAVWHDAATMAAVRASGGLGEAFELPVLMILPGAVLGSIGGVAGATIRRLRPA